MYSKTISPRLCKAKPACAGATLLVRAEALPEHGEAPAGLARGRSCGLKPLSTWKPLRTIVRFRHQDAQTPPSPRVGEGGRGDEGQKARECRTPRIALTNAPLDRGNTPHHPCASVLSVPIRGLFRLYKVKPACAG
jgi:hypothetical protein